MTKCGEQEMKSCFIQASVMNKAVYVCSQVGLKGASQNVIIVVNL